jgi:hypothetical protein
MSREIRTCIFPFHNFLHMKCLLALSMSNRLLYKDTSFSSWSLHVTRYSLRLENPQVHYRIYKMKSLDPINVPLFYFSLYIMFVVISATPLTWFLPLMLSSLNFLCAFHMYSYHSPHSTLFNPPTSLWWRFEVFMLIKMRIMVPFIFTSTLKVEVLSSPEMSVITYKTTRCNSP